MDDGRVIVHRLPSVVNLPMHFRRFPRRRPPWWPNDEPWPPMGPPGLRVWRNMRGRFFWRLGGLFALLSMFTVGGCSLAFWLAFVGAERFHIPRGAVPFLGFSSFVIVVMAFTLIGRSLRRTALPVDDLMEAAGRVEAGDYTARVAERGPREVRALTRAFNAMTERLEKNEAQRRNLLADVTHELRTPLTVVQGNLEALLDGVYPADEAHLSPVLEETRVISRLIDDLRTLALAESGMLKLQREQTDLDVLLGEAVASFQTQADAANIELSLLMADLPLLEIDPVRIREVLSNLIANGLRYTPRGGRVQVTAATTENGVAVSVGDTGSGIAPDDLPHIFDRFYKSVESRGTGLGLAIAKNLVAAHGGEIVAESAPGQGTTIRFTLPLEPV
ncbi:MAG: HAMP domain-containing histidine kinase [Chloroflexi bacterium]|nr:HAMP domain-containing histidine kinase [Chloroflexota bacterium]